MYLELFVIYLYNKYNIEQQYTMFYIEMSLIYNYLKIIQPLFDFEFYYS